MKNEQYTITVSSEFSSAHALRGYKGACEQLHGHNWKVVVSVSSHSLNEIGVVMDFKELKSLLNMVTEGFDHRVINDLDHFSSVNPSSENIARCIYVSLSKLLPKGLTLESVMVSETAGSSATYRLHA